MHRSDLDSDLDIDIESNHFKIVREILNSIFRNSFGIKIYVFGSRANHTSKKYSDLDIAISFDNANQIPISQLVDLKEQFDNSDLPFSVDIVDLNNVDDEFKSHILKTSILISIG